jgi:hypothetical protein
LIPLAWGINLALLLAAFLWIYCDGRSLQYVETLFRKIGSGELLSAADIGNPRFLSGGRVLLMGLVLVVGTLIATFVSLLVGPPRFRTLRWWLVFVGLVSGWLGLWAGWPEIYWRGQQRRVGAGLDAVATLARNLQSNWPRDDGEIAGLGAFLAYPKDAPATLLFLGEAVVPNSALRISAVERTGNGILRFELTSGETGAWLEWRLDGGPPNSFVGGLETSYTAGRYRQLAPNWFLVRYRAARPTVETAR